MTRLLLPALALAGAVAGASSVLAAGSMGGDGRTAAEVAASELGVAGGDDAEGAGPATNSPALGARVVRRTPTADSGRDGARWRWPVTPRPAVLRPFRAPLSDYGPGHRGLDLQVADGTPVVAVEAGVVTHAGDVAGRGTVTVTHAGGLSSTYEPLDPAVSAGSVVAVGDLLGTVRARDGPGHCGARPCLHLGARRGDFYLDPYPLLVRGRLALLPLR